VILKFLNVDLSLFMPLINVSLLLFHLIKIWFQILLKLTF